MLTAVAPFRAYDEARLGGDLPGDLGPKGAETAPLIEAEPMRSTTVSGSLDPGDDGDFVRIVLDAGRAVTLRATPVGMEGTTFALRLADASGKVLAESDRPALVPETGLPGDGPALTFRAPADGVYLVGLVGLEVESGPVVRSYVVEVRPIGLNKAAIESPEAAILGGLGATAPPGPGLAGVTGPGLASTGPGIIGSLVAGRLSLAGPTGYGFEMTGNWTQITTPVGGGQTSITFVASAGVGIVTPIGTLPVPLPPGVSIIMTTKPNGAGGAFGEIDRTRILTGLAWLDRITESMTTHYGSTYVLPDGSGSLDVQQGVDVGLALGSTIMASIDVNAPLNANVPYFYVVFATGASASFGNFTVSAGSFGGQTKITAFADPADPFAYFGLALPGDVPVFSSAGVGASLNGRVPFRPNPAPSQWNGEFFGHVYSQLELNIPAYKIVNVNVNGKTVINVDALSDHALIDYLEANPALIVGGAWAVGTLGEAFLANPALFQNLAVGANASLGVNVAIPTVANATFTLARATAIYTGTASPNLYFRSEATDNLAAGTVLAPYMQYLRPTQNFVVDGHASPGLFNATYSAGYAFFGATAELTTRVIATGLNGAAPAISATITGTASLLGVVNATITGTIAQTGAFQIDGLGNVTIAGFTLSQGKFRITNQGIALDGRLNLGVIGTVTVAGAAVTNGSYVLIGTFTTDWGMALAPQVAATAVLSNAGLAATTTVAFLGQQASLSGAIQPNLNFSLTGNVDVGFSFLGISASANSSVVLARAGGATTLGGNFVLMYTVLGFEYSLAMSVFLAYAGGFPNYSGVGTATAIEPVFGTQLTGEVAIDKNRMRIKVPLAPTVTIPLPF